MRIVQAGGQGLMIRARVHGDLIGIDVSGPLRHAGGKRCNSQRCEPGSGETRAPAPVTMQNVDENMRRPAKPVSTGPRRA